MINILKSNNKLSKIIWFSVIAVFFFAVGVKHQYLRSFLRTIHSVIETDNPSNLYVQDTLSTIQIDTLSIYVSEKHFAKIIAQRKEALAVPGMGDMAVTFRYVKAKLSFKDWESKVKIKLKGDRKIHFSDSANWSFRIKLETESSQIPRKFSIQHPKTKNYIHEWIFHRILKLEGLIGLQYKFYRVMLNDKYWGLMALEEHFTSELLKNNDRDPGAVFRAIEDRGSNFYTTPFFEPYGATLDSIPYEESLFQWKKLNDFFSGKNSMCSTVNVDLFAKYFAITDLLGVHHGCQAKSMRFYYNKQDSLFEPVGYDGHQGTDKYDSTLTSEFAYSSSSGWNYQDSTWYQLYFRSKFKEDTIFYRKYYDYLNYYSGEEFSQKFDSKIQRELSHNLDVLNSDGPLYADHVYSFGPDIFVFDSEFLVTKQKHINKAINKANKLLVSLISCKELDMKLYINNSSKFLIRIDKISVKNKSIKLKEKLYLYPNEEYSFKKYKIRLQSKLIEKDFDNLMIHYSIVGKENGQESNKVNVWGPAQSKQANR